MVNCVAAEHTPASNKQAQKTLGVICPSQKILGLARFAKTTLQSSCIRERQTLKPLMIDNDMGSPQTFDSARLRGKENNAPQEQDLFTFSAKLDKTARIVFAKGFLDI